MCIRDRIHGGGPARSDSSISSSQVSRMISPQCSPPSLPASPTSTGGRRPSSIVEEGEKEELIPTSFDTMWGDCGRNPNN
eukprot:8295790-Pyramimonas_sp.AAC.1